MSTAVLLFPPKLKRAKPHHHIGNKSPLKENPDLTGGGNRHTYATVKQSSFVIIKPQTFRSVYFVMTSQISSSQVSCIWRELDVLTNVGWIE